MNNNYPELSGIYVRVNPYDYTSTIPKVRVTNIRKHYEYNKSFKKQFNYTYVYYVYCNDVYLRAKNWSEHSPKYLDGLIGCVKLREFNQMFKPL